MSIQIHYNVRCIQSHRLRPESLPAPDLAVSRDPINQAMLSILTEQLEMFETAEDPLIEEVFGEIHDGAYFDTMVVVTEGVPDIYDSWTAQFEGNPAIFFNLSGWTEDDLAETGLSIIKHELTHLLMEPLIQKPDTDDYLAQLNVIVLDDGIANWIGYAGDRDRLLVEYLDRWDQAEKQLTEAMNRLKKNGCSRSERASIVQAGNTGRYWSRYAAISGMFRAAHTYETQGSRGLIKAIQRNELPALIR